jgi:hypothetical protein
MIAGYTSPEQIFATLDALRAERKHARSPAHADAVDRQLAIFQAEADRITAAERKRIKAEAEQRLRNAEAGLSWH